MPWMNVEIGRGVGLQIGEGAAHLHKSCWTKVARRKKRIWTMKKIGSLRIVALGSCVIEEIPETVVGVVRVINLLPNPLRG
jgi:hypothetical protein